MTRVAGDTGRHRLATPRPREVFFPHGACPHARTTTPRAPTGARTGDRRSTVPAGADADVDDARAPRLGPARRRPQAGRADRAADLVRTDRHRGRALRARDGLRLVRLLVAQQHRACWAGADRADADGGRLGATCSSTRGAWATRSRCARSSAWRWSGINGVLCFTVAGGLLFASHVVGGAEGLHERHVHRRPGDRRPRRPLQRAAPRRRLRRRPLGPAPRQPVGRQHRRRDRRDGAVRAAAQHAQLPVPRGLDHGRAVPGRLRLRRPVRAQLAGHVGRRPQEPLQGRAPTPASRRPRKASRGSPG